MSKSTAQKLNSSAEIRTGYATGVFPKEKSTVWAHHKDRADYGNIKPKTGAKLPLLEVVISVLTMDLKEAQFIVYFVAKSFCPAWPLTWQKGDV